MSRIGRSQATGKATCCGSGHRRIATLVVRSTRCVTRVQVERRDTTSAVYALIEHARRQRNRLYQPLTWQRGRELADRRRFTLATDILVYSCDPLSPWQRGSNEDTGGLLRQDFPAGIDVSGLPRARRDEVARRLNEQPRRTLHLEAPVELYDRLLR